MRFRGKRRMLAVLLACLTLTLALPAMAEGKVKISAAVEGDVYSGGTFKVRVSAADDNGATLQSCAGMIVDLEYDPNKVEVANVGVNLPGDFVNAYNPECTLEGSNKAVRIAFVNYRLDTTKTISNIMTVTFRAKSLNEGESLTFQTKVNEAYVLTADAADSVTYPKVEGSNITEGTGNATAVTPPPYILGDVNSDREVGLTDAVWLLQYCAKLRNSSEIALQAGDVNKDGDVGLPDAVWILQRCAKLRDADFILQY